MTENFNKHLPNSDSLINMGISGDFSEGLIRRIENVINYQPDNLFIMIGINDLIEKIPLTEIQDNYVELLNLIQSNCPKTNIYIESTLPTCGLNSFLTSSKDINERVQNLNRFLQSLTSKRKLKFIDMYSEFKDAKNALRSDLTTDGIHLNKKGYDIWLSKIYPYLFRYNYLKSKNQK